MRTLALIISIFCLVSAALPVTNLDSNPNLGLISKAISEGDATTLGAYFDNNIDLTILSSQDILPRTKAIDQIAQFFAKNKPKSFNAVHQGSSKGNGSHYTIGDMPTASGTFRVYLYYRASGDKVIIQEMRIEK